MIKNVDPERIRRLIGSMRESVRILYEIKNLPELEFKGDIHKQGSAKYNFIAAIEAAIDIANHIISKKASEPRKIMPIRSGLWRKPVS